MPYISVELSLFFIKNFSLYANFFSINIIIIIIKCVIINKKTYGAHQPVKCCIL